MLTLHLQRQPSSEQGTRGMLTGISVDLHALELPWVDANGDGLGDPQRSCITAGTYKCVWQESPHFGWCYEVTGVEGRSRILIHPANFAGDTDKGWQSDLLGCIALGIGKGVMPNKAGRTQICVTQSKAAIAKFHATMAEQDFMLTIVDNQGE